MRITPFAIGPAISAGRDGENAKGLLTDQFLLVVQRKPFGPAGYASPRKGLNKRSGQTGGRKMAATKPKKGIAEAVRFANAHGVRTDILCLLNEYSYTAQELSRLVGQPLSTITHHLEALLEHGSIEVASQRQIRNFVQNRYRAIEIPFFTDEAMAELTFDQRQQVYGLIIQAATAEAMASFSAGKISDDPRALMAWKWFNVDRQGKEEIADELASSWERVLDIEAKSMQRRCETGEPASTLIVTSFGYERTRQPDEPAAHVRGKLVDRTKSI
jgi:DNA-binding transcriptional ArsR family regulator